mmetsp:Transcript_59781/g.146889  ORF Transcript_59781/g.146889 Transcript_59781/m.146889 type:complete len:203 (-) Transcript_59781:2278-2886(-)
MLPVFSSAQPHLLVNNPNQPRDELKITPEQTVQLLTTLFDKVCKRLLSRKQYLFGHVVLYLRVCTGGCRTKREPPGWCGALGALPPKDAPALLMPPAKVLGRLGEELQLDHLIFCALRDQAADRHDNLDQQIVPARTQKVSLEPKHDCNTSIFEDALGCRTRPVAVADNNNAGLLIKLEQVHKCVKIDRIGSLARRPAPANR